MRPRRLQYELRNDGVISEDGMRLEEEELRGFSMMPAFVKPLSSVATGCGCGCGGGGVFLVE